MVTGSQKTPAEDKHTGRSHFQSKTDISCASTIIQGCAVQVHQNKRGPTVGSRSASSLSGEQDSDESTGAACEPDAVGGPRGGLLQVTQFHFMLMSQY